MTLRKYSNSNCTSTVRLFPSHRESGSHQIRVDEVKKSLTKVSKKRRGNNVKGEISINLHYVEKSLDRTVQRRNTAMQGMIRNRPKKTPRNATAVYK